MIRLTGLNHKEFIINDDNIEKIEEVPETIITMINGNKYLVEEDVDTIINLTINYKIRLQRSDFK